MDERVTIEEGVAVGTAPGRDPNPPTTLRADLYRPPARLGDPPTGGWPSILLVHGGSWRHGDRKQLQGYGVLFAREGYVAVTCEYRLSPRARWPEHLHDVKTVLRWMRASADDLAIDPDRLVISGNSAGGHLALIAAGSPGAGELEGAGGNPGHRTDVAACVAIYAPSHLYWERPSRGGGPVDMVTDRPSEDVARQASPLRWVSPAFPPTLLIHGADDEVVSEVASRNLYDALRRAGVPVELHIYAGQPHAFDADPRYGRRTADEILFFLSRHLPKPAPGTGPPSVAPVGELA